MTNQMFGYRTLGFGGIAEAEFDPTTIPGCAIWLRSDMGVYEDQAKTTPATDDGDVVGAWEDQSGNAHDALQPTTSKKPLLKLNIVNGHPAIRFDGADDWLGNTDLNEEQANMMFFVYSNTGNDSTVIDGNVTTLKRHYLISRWATDELRLFGYPANLIITTTSPISSSDFYLVSCLANSSSSYIRVNGSQEISGTIGGSDIEGYVLGGDINKSASYLFHGDMAEFIFYNTEISADNLALVEAYLMSRYGIT